MKNFIAFPNLKKEFMTYGNGSIAPRSSAVNVVAFVYLHIPGDGRSTETCSVTVN
jgi:hypothetical protein